MDKPAPDNLQRLLDYHLNLDDPDQRRQTQELISSDQQVRSLSDTLSRTLKPLSSWSDAPAPLGLAQRTMQFINQHEQVRVIAEASAALAGHRDAPKATSMPSSYKENRTRWILGNLRDLVTAAACILLVVMVSRPVSHRMRQLNQQVACASNMKSIGTAFNQYALDYQGYLPFVEYQPGAFWWSIGKADKKNAPNTRNVYLLIRQNYVSPEAFLCPGSPQQPSLRLMNDPESLKKRQDFPNRKHIHYSFKLILDKIRLDSDRSLQMGIMGDLNPHFTDFDGTNKHILDLAADPSLLQKNSPNHGGTGQNLLYPDGRVSFYKARHLAPNLDDIYTMKGIYRYKGNERPDSNDILLAP